MVHRRLRHPDPRRPRQAGALHAEAEAVLRRQKEPHGGAVPGLLAIRRRELFRTAAADLLGLLDSSLVAEAIGSVTAVTIAGALELASAGVGRSTGDMRICVVAMGRFGGHEMG